MLLGLVGESNGEFVFVLVFSLLVCKFIYTALYFMLFYSIILIIYFEKYIYIYVIKYLFYNLSIQIKEISVFLRKLFFAF